MNNLSIECLSFRECSKGFLLGFANIRVNAWNMEISDIQLMEKEGFKFIKMPSRTYEKDGEKKYWPYIRFTDREKGDQFSSQVVEAIKFYRDFPR